MFIPPQILVVDDEPSIRDMVTVMLSASGYPAVACSTSEKALAILQQGSINAVLSDINLPGMSGFDLLENIHLRHPDIPVILMTGYAALDTAVDAIHKSKTRSLTK